ncbi:MAG TPA: hypothetical protein VM431_01680 [Phycisphaerae bacterium]|nr:hypothetical protein [Phycisphaerae bacterium]
MKGSHCAILVGCVLTAAAGCTRVPGIRWEDEARTNATAHINLVPDITDVGLCIKDVPYCNPNAPEESCGTASKGLYYPSEMLRDYPQPGVSRADQNWPPSEIIECLRGGLQYEMGRRANVRDFRSLCGLLAGDFRHTRRLAVLEVYNAPYDYSPYGFILLAETSSGYWAAASLPRWKEFRGRTGVIRKWHVDGRRAAPWFDGITRSRLPDAHVGKLGVGRASEDTGALYVAVLGSRPRFVAFADVEMMEMIRGYEPLGPQATDEEVCGLLENPKFFDWLFPDRSQQLPGKSPEHWPPQVLGPARHHEYDRVRNRYAAAIGPLWEMTLGWPSLKDVGGWSAALAGIRKLTWVGGCQVGTDRDAGEFYWLSKALCRDGTPEQFRQLLDDPSPTVRAMGMLCVARTAPAEEASAVLRARLKRRDSLVVLITDHGQDLNEGRLAWVLLRNVNFLHLDLPARPAVPRAEQMAIDLEILAADNLPHLRLNAASALEFRLASKELELSLQALERMCPRLSRLQIIKAVGRIWPEPGTPRAEAARAFLISCLNDGALDTDCRLAACSALARDPSDAAERAIESQKDWLMKCTDRDLYARFREDLAAARLYEAALRAEVEWGTFGSNHFQLRFGSAKDVKADVVAEEERLAGAFTQAEQKLLECRHPLNPYGLQHHMRGHDDCWWDARPPPRGDAAALWACAVSARLGEYAKPWDTFAYLAADLDQELECDAERAKDKAELLAEGFTQDWLGFQEVLGETRYRALVENVRQALAAQGGAADDR